MPAPYPCFRCLFSPLLLTQRQQRTANLVDCYERIVMLQHLASHEGTGAFLRRQTKTTDANKKQVENEFDFWFPLRFVWKKEDSIDWSSLTSITTPKKLQYRWDITVRDKQIIEQAVVEYFEHKNEANPQSSAPVRVPTPTAVSSETSDINASVSTTDNHRCNIIIIYRATRCSVCASICKRPSKRFTQQRPKHWLDEKLWHQ